MMFSWRSGSLTRRRASLTWSSDTTPVVAGASGGEGLFAVSSGIREIRLLYRIITYRTPTKQERAPLGARSVSDSALGYLLFFELFFAELFLLALFFAVPARLLAVALAMVWWREVPCRRRVARGGGGFQPTSRSARKARDPDASLGPSRTESTAASDRSARTSEITLAGRSARAA